MVLILGACTGVPKSSNATDDRFGVLLMAHGGEPEWNAGVLSAVEPLRDRYVIEVAFGMADPATIQEAVARLEGQGITRIGVVRLFVSGESWYERTEQILGIEEGAPPRRTANEHAREASHHGHGMELWRIDTSAAFALSTEGLADAEEMEAVLADRAQTLSRDPENEDVLVLAHGPGDDRENERWIATIQERARAIEARLPFRRVAVATLREDWPEKRKKAERRIRAFVDRATEEGGTALVIPFRVYGFGPYARVLQGLDYVSDGRGLIPHRNVTRWIAKQIKALEDARFESATAEAQAGRWPR
ncbi:MAG TPA: hypothetical protein ENI87_02070 [bacterium]|nr:hypothetical protein [bacterium]